MWNVFYFSMLCTCSLLKFDDSEEKAKTETETGDCYLTLPSPEIPPVHPSALPGWTPGPGNFHYGTAEGHSHQARREEDTVRYQVVFNFLNM